MIFGFDLSLLLDEEQVQWISTTPGVMDCRDFAVFLKILLESHGQSSQAVIMKVTGVDPESGAEIVGFRSLPLCPAGSDPNLVSNYLSYDFEYHSLVSQDGVTVYDASVSHRFTLSGASFLNPVNGWPLADWVQTWNSPQSIFGLVRGVFWGDGNESDPYEVEQFTGGPVPISYLK